MAAPMEVCARCQNLFKSLFNLSKHCVNNYSKNSATDFYKFSNRYHCLKTKAHNFNVFHKSVLPNFNYVRQFLGPGSAFKGFSQSCRVESISCCTLSSGHTHNLLRKSSCWDATLHICCHTNTLSNWSKIQPHKPSIWPNANLFRGSQQFNHLSQTEGKFSNVKNPKNVESEGDTEQEKSDIIKENIWTIPNLLTISRICMSPLLGYLVLQESFHLACALFVTAGITDLLDGYIARTWPSQISSLGSFLDPLADKFLMTILFVTLTQVQLIPMPLTVLVVARDVCLVVAAFYVRYITLPPPITFYRFFDGTNATAQLKPTFLSKINTTLQLSLVGVTLVAPVLDFVNHPLLQGLWYLVATTTLLTSVQYMTANDTYKTLKRVTQVKKKTS